MDLTLQVGVTARQSEPCLVLLLWSLRYEWSCKILHAKIAVQLAVLVRSQ